MLITTCPRCSEKVLVPAGANPTSQVRCPLCEAEYTLSDAMADLPPALVLLDPPAPALDLEMDDDLNTGAAALASLGLDDELEDSLDDTDEFTTSHDPTVSEEPTFHFDDDKSPAADDDIDFGLDESTDDTSNDDELKMGEPEEVVEDSVFDFGGGPGGGTATATRQVSTTPTRNVKKKKKKNPLKLMLEVVFGGLAAIIAVQAILWWFPWIPQDKRDPFDLAKKLPSYIAFLAPADLRGETPTEPEADPADEALANGGTPVDQAQGGFGDEFDDKFAPQGEGADDDTTLHEADDHEGHDHEHLDGDHEDELAGVEAFRENFGEDADVDIGGGDIGGPDLGETDLGGNDIGVPDIDLDPLAETGDDTDDELDDELGDELDDELVLDDEDMLPPGDETETGEESVEDEVVSNVPAFLQPASVADLAAALADAETAIEARAHADEAPAEERSNIARNYYTSLSHLAAVLGGVSPAEAIADGTVDDVSEILEQVGHSPGEFEFLGTVAAGWLRPGVRRNDGIVLTGQVIAVEPAGDYYATQLQLPGDKGTIVEVLTAGDPSALLEGGYAEGASVLIVGTVIDAPAGTVPGYAGAADQIVWSSAAVNIEAE